MSMKSLIAAGLVSAPATQSPAASTLRVAQSDTATKATKKAHKHKAKKTTATDTMSAPK